ncbi:MAG: glycoside hydrolase family 2 [Anaerolineae bacterium]|nr:glycoside hydrolase family 2 [Anaerolineae bacterium]
MTYRTRLSLDGTWDFWREAAPETVLTVNVPAPWQATAELRDFNDAGWYRCGLNLPATWLAEERVIILHFGAVDYFAEVWLNGILIGEHEGGYLPFELDITAAAHAGANNLTVRVTDPLEIFPEIPHGKQSWYGMLSGLWQSVWVESRAATHIQHVHVAPQGEEVSIEVQLNRMPAPEIPLGYEIFAPNGEIVATLKSSFLRPTLHVSAPQLWDIDEPNLYRLRVTLEGAQGDSITETFGFRTIEARQGQLWLNGRPLYLRAALDQDYYPETLCTPPSEAFLEDQFRKAKAMGLNCLRTHIKIADPRYYDAADRIGLLIWTEMPNAQALTPESQRRARETLEGMVARDGNHPSIVIWTIINESWGIDLSDPAQRRWLAETYDYLKRVDPTRLIVDNSACAGNFHVVTDIEDFHNYYAMPDHYTHWRDWVAAFAGRPWWTFAHAYTTQDAWRTFMHNPWDAAPLPPAPEVQRRGNEPLILSEFGNWGLPHITQLQDGNGNEPWWFETGLNWGNGVVYPHGVKARYTQYHLHRTFPTFADLVAASQRLEYTALKYEIEQIRRHSNLAGYVITEFTDVHWECNGLLDMHRNPKDFFTALGALNNDDLIIPEWKRLAYWSGEEFTLGLLLSHFSRTDLGGSSLEWEVNGYPELSGVFEALAPKTASVTTVGQIPLIVPEVAKPERLRILLRLRRKDGTLAAEQHQEFFAFPQCTVAKALKLYAPGLEAPLCAAGHTSVETLAEAEIAVATTLTDGLRAYLLQGGRVLWLAESDDALQTHLEGFAIAPRRGRDWQGDWASSLSWICKEQLFGALPTPGEVDFLFNDLTPEHVITGLGPRDFAVDVHAGLTVGWLHKTVGLIAERRVGQTGRLLISTFRLSANLAENPVAAWMLRDMIERLGNSTA